MFIDRVKIKVISGKGGDGCVAFLREKFCPRGGPAGGNGGKGGDVILRVSSKLHTLLDFYYKHTFRAENGQNGKGKNAHGKDGADMIINVPRGTVVYDAEDGKLVADLLDGEIVVARGGKGGRGNAEFATPWNQAPAYAEPGELAEEKSLILELRLIADVGIIGLPNAGKSTLLSKVTHAHPKIAPYPFTTKFPHLGIAKVKNEKIILADMPGIIEGAHKGKGMGLDFLRHISRTKAIVVLLDILDNPENAYKILLDELKQYDPVLLSRPRIVALNKIDSADKKLVGRNWRRAFPGEKIILMSAIAGKNVDKLVKTLYEILNTYEI